MRDRLVAIVEAVRDDSFTQPVKNVSSAVMSKRNASKVRKDAEVDPRCGPLRNVSLADYFHPGSGQRMRTADADEHPKTRLAPMQMPAYLRSGNCSVWDAGSC